MAPESPVAGHLGHMDLDVHFCVYVICAMHMDLKALLIAFRKSNCTVMLDIHYIPVQYSFQKDYKIKKNCIVISNLQFLFTLPSNKKV